MEGAGRNATPCVTQFDQPRDGRIARLAARQHGIVGLGQLVDLGLSASAVRKRVASGRVHRVHRGVYSVGHPLLTSRGQWMAAVLACGGGAALSHRSAAALHGLRASARALIDVTVPHRGGRGRAGIDIHRSTTLFSADVTAVEGIPCTSVCRTLLDLAEVVRLRELERTYEQACVMRCLDGRELEAVLLRAQGRRGTTALRGLQQAGRPGDGVTRSELEERLLALCTTASIPRPEVNAWLALDDGTGLEVDFLWRRERLVVETDGHRFHSSRAAFERDRRRDGLLLLAGWRVLRCTWRQVVAEPDGLADTIRRLLER